ncbi:CHAD domain-containing protein [Gaopeijia maritima]|uniref:CHAD domain-containing protein n=1 Tax=Gaopeijia maritima TaxID=3119007 RepID=A0ABU9E9W4_9BACT
MQSDTDSDAPDEIPSGGYRLGLAETVAEGVHRMAREEVDGALARLRDPRYDANEALHDARTRLRKVRALLRLAQDAIGIEVFETEDAAYKQALKLLDPARESYVAVRTVESLRGDFTEVLRPSAFVDLQARLEERHHRILRHTLREGVVPEAIIQLETARGRIDGWPLELADDRVLERGLRRAYERGYASMARAYEPEGGLAGRAFRLWRREARYLWFHYRVIAGAWPPVFEAMADEQLRLSHELGVGKDLGDLIRIVRDADDLADSQWPLLALTGLARERRKYLWQGLRSLGTRLYADTPDAFRDRMRRILQAARGS